MSPDLTSMEVSMGVREEVVLMKSLDSLGCHAAAGKVL